MFVQKSFLFCRPRSEPLHTNAWLLLEETAQKKPLCPVAIQRAGTGRQQHRATGPPDGTVATSCPRAITETMPTSMPLEDTPRTLLFWHFLLCFPLYASHVCEASPTVPHPSPRPHLRTSRPPAKSHLVCFSPGPRVAELPPSSAEHKLPNPSSSQQAPYRRQNHPSGP